LAQRPTDAIRPCRRRQNDRPLILDGTIDDERENARRGRAEEQ
jgi:hypothetical protein